MEQREVIILGGGLMALAIGLELQLRGAAVTVLGADFAAAAGHAAAGMLAPQAEGLLPGPMQDLCLRSRSAYADWAEQLARRTGKSVGYWPSGIMAPAYAAADFNHPATDWRSLIDLRQIQPGLSDAVQGGWYFPQDAQVDNVQLMQALWQAARDAGVELRDRVKIAAIVTASPSRDRAVQHLQTDCGQWQADHYVLATGAWSQSLLPIPVKPIKGQMLSLQWPDRGDAPLPLQCVLFGSHIYVVPRQDGRIVLGATSEDVGFAPDNTAAGVHQLLHEALRLFPALAQRSCGILGGAIGPPRRMSCRFWVRVPIGILPWPRDIIATAFCLHQLRRT